MAAALRDLLKPQTSSDIQLAAVRALANQDYPKVAETLLASWEGYSPQIRREVLEALFARPDRVSQLLDAIEAKKVFAGQLEPSRLDLLRKYPNAKIRQRASRTLDFCVLAGRKQSAASDCETGAGEKPTWGASH